MHNFKFVFFKRIEKQGRTACPEICTFRIHFI